jgi:hypothetical protein
LSRAFIPSYWNLPQVQFRQEKRQIAGRRTIRTRGNPERVSAGERWWRMIMDVNHKLTRVLKGRIVQSMQVDASEVSIGFFDGSIMQIKIMESNSPPLREQAHIRTISEDKVKILIECEDESTFDVTLAEPGNSLSVRNKNNQIEYLG